MTKDVLTLPRIVMGAKSPTPHSTQSYDKDRSPLIELTIGDFLIRWWNKTLRKTPLISAHQNIRPTYRELQRKVNQLASSMIRMGLAKGDRVGIWSHNNVEWVIMQLATLKPVLYWSTLTQRIISGVCYNKADCRALVLMRHFRFMTMR